MKTMFFNQMERTVNDFVKIREYQSLRPVFLAALSGKAQSHYRKRELSLSFNLKKNGSGR